MDLVAVCQQRCCDEDSSKTTFLAVPSVTTVVCRVIWGDEVSGELPFYIYHGLNAITHTELLERRRGGGDSPLD